MKKQNTKGKNENKSTVSSSFRFRLLSNPRFRYLGRKFFRFFDRHFIRKYWYENIMASNVTFNRIPLKLGKLSIGIGSYSADEIDVWHTSNFTSIRIGNYTSIGRGLKLIATGGHSTKLISTYGFASFDGRKSGREAVFNLGDISIGNDVWIGDDVTIMGGVQVQDGVIIGTKSLVTKDLDAFGVYGGVPAKLLKYRFSLRIIRELKKIKWWDLPPELLKRNINIFYEKNIPSAVAKLSSLRRDYDRSLRKN